MDGLLLRWCGRHAHAVLPLGGTVASAGDIDAHAHCLFHTRRRSGEQGRGCEQLVSLAHQLGDGVLAIGALQKVLPRLLVHGYNFTLAPLEQKVLPGVEAQRFLQRLRAVYLERGLRTTAVHLARGTAFLLSPQAGEVAVRDRVHLLPLERQLVAVGGFVEASEPLLHDTGVVVYAGGAGVVQAAERRRRLVERQRLHELVPVEEGGADAVVHEHGFGAFDAVLVTRPLCWDPRAP